MSDTAKEQAIAQAQSIVKLVLALNVDYDRLEELRGERDNLQVDVADIETSEEVHAIAVESLRQWSASYGEELAQLEADAGDCKDADEARGRIQEHALDVQVRSNWYNPCGPNGGETDSKPIEFYILLCTGGPAVRIMGELDDNLEPCRAWIEAQDWGTQWESVHIGEGFESGALLSYCNQFYFGE